MAGPSGPRDGGAGRDGGAEEPDREPGPVPWEPPASAEPPELGPAETLGAADVAARWAEITERLGPLDGAARPDSPGPRDYVVEDDDEGFVPPDPPPRGGGDPAVVLGWSTVAAGVVAFLVLAVAWDGAPGGLLTLAVVLVLAGTGILLWRMPRRRDGDAGGGGGAVV